MRLVFLAILGLVSTATAWALDPVEQQLVDYVDAHREAALGFLEEVVAINSGTLHVEGVREVGRRFATRLEAVGLEVGWIDMPEEMQRSGHLFAERTGHRGRRLLLIGHLDTVFEPDSEFQAARREGDQLHGPGALDMKGGNVVIQLALEALQSVGALEGTQIIVALTGDEEKPGSPLELARRDLIEAGRRSDVALGFEAGIPGTATVARRGFSSWQLTVTARPAHSSGIFGDGAGAGAVFEAARVLDAFYSHLRGEKSLTFNPGAIVGGTEVSFDPDQSRGRTFGKDNVIAESAIVHGDLRFISEAQRDAARDRMRAVAAQSLPHTSSRMEFVDGYPAMAPTPANYELLERFDQVSRDLGLGGLEPFDPAGRGAADISFVAEHVGAALAGLGPSGRGSHSVQESVDVDSLAAAAKRAAVLIYRLTR